MIQTFLLKGISFKFDNTDTADGYIQVFRIDDNNKYILHKTIDSKIEFKKIVGGVTNILTSSAQTFSKHQIFNILVTVDDGVGTTLRILKNNGTVLEVTNTDKTIIRGNASMYLHDNDGTKQPNCFIQKVMYIPNKNYTLNEASVILKGRNDIDVNDSNLNAIATQFASQELFDITKVPLNGHSVLSNGVITHNATSQWEYNTTTINVLPNNQYTINGSGTGYVKVYEYYNNILLNSRISVGIAIGDTFTTSSKTNNIRVSLTNATVVGTVTYSNISLKIKM